MAGMEQLEIHSKSYIVRWVKVEEGHTISWSVQPHRKSINFGIVKHPGAGATSAASTLRPPNERLESESAQAQGESAERLRRSSTVKNDLSTAEEQLKAKGFIPVEWYGKCDADKVTIGTYAVNAGNGGMFGLVFDNTFSKAVSKTATFVLLTYPSNFPPNPTHHNLQGGPGGKAMSTVALAQKSSNANLSAAANESVDSLHSRPHSASSRETSVVGKGMETAPPSFHVGILMKRRRKRGQGYARRYFSLDFISCTLSYYYNRNSSALRGAIPLSLAAIAADERRREISIDSGAEIWHLKAGNAKDFAEWTRALELASNKARGNVPGKVVSKTGKPLGMHMGSNSVFNRPIRPPSEEDLEWDQVESLVSRIVGSRDAVRRLANDTKSSYKQSWAGLSLGAGNPAVVPEENGDYFNNPAEKRPFWKRKTSTRSTLKKGAKVASASSNTSSNITPQSTPSAPSPAPPGQVSKSSRRSQATSSEEESSINDHCQALLKDLDLVLSDLNQLITRSKQRRYPPGPALAVPRRSMDSTSTGEFYDAEAGDGNDSQIIVVGRSSDEDTPASDHDESMSGDNASSVASDLDETPKPAGAVSFFPPKPKTLAPLPVTSKPKRRTTLKPATMLPPSLISVLRKNVGKDLSGISMPVSSNEPLSALQRVAEGLEYAQLLDAAAKSPSPQHRHLLVAAFSISYFSSSRARERAIRKPFNPMLGETFELVRSDSETPGNFRFLAEKVSHRPVKMACQADSPLWSFAHSSTPVQKFWGKSAELITEGKVYAVLRLADGVDECYSWPIATVFLRNVVMGEKYFEPVGSVSVLNESSGAVAVVEYKSKGMFGGRSEDVEVGLWDATGVKTALGLEGTWTSSLNMTEKGKVKGEVWHVGSLVSSAESRYGFTTFAATLNELTAVEEGKTAVTDSRLRPDQRAAEEGDLDTAEEVKKGLEERQRGRRTEMEGRGEMWEPRWFERVEGEEECWRLRTGARGYWEERAKGSWEGVEDIFALD
ncbi:hypothetical protein VC83_08459 [Pseudogymnoascus destructans]|uniref:PH domain-containing protein n=2 Tax=Pseudogymnoascus destructans TaxID=655981 RepID=L8FQB4_PSED2|nr:uncharacterized protein VC83_08459 [Pseudogymnoascus destructans]ELR03150.1 hypothetical protein GMDG_05979 [Pseudogymnoascus destructans 20631-21]OAF55138.1 hypothetical protein VC83_08459 [Pseudogymnoascus destructans]